MKKATLHIAILLVVSIMFMSAGSPSKSYSLFKIGRTRDANEIIYDINLSSNGNLNTNNPVSIYWIKKTKGGVHESLTTIQEKFAYGISYLSKNEHTAVFQFVSYDKRTFTLKKDSNNIYRVFTMSGGKEVVVNQIFIHIEGGTFWFPSIPKVELYATDISSGNSFIEVIYT